MAPLNRLYVELPRMELQGVSWEGFQEEQDSPIATETLRDYVWNHCQEQLLKSLTVVPGHSKNEAPSPIDRITDILTPKIKDYNLKNQDTMWQAPNPSLPQRSFTDPAHKPQQQQQQQQWMQEDLGKAAKKLKLLENLADAQRQYLELQGPQEVFRKLLPTLLEIMGAEYGFLAEIKTDDMDQPSFHIHALSDISWDAASKSLDRDYIDRGLAFHNHSTLIGHVLQSAQPLISNSPSTDPRRGGLPMGHPPLHSFMGLPFFDARTGKVNGMVGLANKPGGFVQRHVDFLEPCVRICGNLLQAYLSWTPQMPQDHSNCNNHSSSHHPPAQGLEESQYFYDAAEDDKDGSYCQRHHQQRIQELELANIQLAQAREQVLQQSQAQLRHFACSSHEIRTPLNCIIGLSSLLQTTELNPMQAESMQLISSSSELLLTVVNDVLDYSKLESGHVDVSIKPSNLQDILVGVVQSMELKTRDKNIRVRTEYSPFLPPIYQTDRLRLQQILFNLLGNAFKFSDPDTCIDLKVQIGPPGRPSVAAHATPLAVPCVLRFIVQDYGCGIQPNQLENIFQPFVQAGDDTKRLYEGTGLGLAITSKLVLALGGCVYANSRVNVGSEFIVELPFTEKAFDVVGMGQQLAKTTVLLIPGQNMPVDRVPVMEKVLEAYKVPYQTLSSMDDLDRVMLQNSSSSFDYSRRSLGSSASSISMASDDSASTYTTNTVSPPIVLPNDHAYVCFIDESVYEREVMQRWKEQPVSTVLLTFGPDYTVAETSNHYRNLLQIVPSVLMQSLVDAVGEAQSQSTPAGSRQPRRRSTAQINIKQKKKKKPHVVSRNKDDIAILIVEDNVINQKVLRALLKKLGYTHVCVVGDGQLAVDAVEQTKYDVVLMDVQMPVMDGLEATRVIGQRQKEKSLKLGDAAGVGPKIVFVTATVDQALEDEAKELGAVGFVPKPFNLRQLETCMTEICRSLG